LKHKIGQEMVEGLGLGGNHIYKKFITIPWNCRG